jgi:phosphopantothenoylcysteine decarboxylase / phosphopantothenate---cysteine ligase
MTEKRVLLIIGGGISAYKTPQLIRELDKKGIKVRVILTAAGSQFVTALTLASLTRDHVHTELFDLTAETKMGHIELSRSADLVVVAPATADLMAKLAHGLANDLASTALLATDKPIMMVPAMNVRMWDSPSVQRNLATLKGDGVVIIGPDEGPMACGEFGLGRMAEPEIIAETIEQFFASDKQDKTLAGRHAIVTAGPTLEAMDPVRYLSNRSSGKQGYAIAGALAFAGARVTLVSGPTALEAPPGVKIQRVESALEMLEACNNALPADIFIGVAAVADWRTSFVADQKLKTKDRSKGHSLELVENPDILATIARGGKTRPQLVIGFAAETEHTEDFGKAKRIKKGCDWILANDVSGNVMGGDTNAIIFITETGSENWESANKEAIAGRLVGEIATFLGG